MSNSLEQIKANRDAELLEWYYAFREVEVPDEEAWRMAVRKMDKLIAEKSNALTKVEAELGQCRRTP